MADVIKTNVTKLEVAQRQLHCAIELWFRDADLVSIHTLARAAYDVIHDLSLKKGMPRDLLYNTDIIRAEHQDKWAKHLRKPGNFAKHADKDPNATVEFDPVTTLGFIMFAIRGLGSLGEKSSPHTIALGIWLAIHDPNLVRDEFRKSIFDRLPVEELAQLRKVQKSEFLDGFLLLQSQSEIAKRQFFEEMGR